MTNPTKPDAFEAALEAHLATDRAATGITLGEALWIARWAREWTLRSDPVVTAMAEALGDAVKAFENIGGRGFAGVALETRMDNALAAWRELADALEACRIAGRDQASAEIKRDEALAAKGELVEALSTACEELNLAAARFQGENAEFYREQANDGLRELRELLAKHAARGEGE